MQWLAAILVSLMLGACAGVGPATKIGVTMPDGEKATIVAHNQSVPDWMLAKDKLALNYIVKSDVSAKQLAAVAEAERACRIYTGTVRPNNLVTVISNGAIYAIAGGIGVGLGAKAFPGAVYREYQRYGAAAGLFAGAANGMVTLGGQTYTFENCGREVLALFPGYDVKILQKSPY
ncbi:hypothetical protein KGQ72_02685 [Patescibacteria group bacterium]|nr:hypothetical protein [Patescibacteria group bacterium]